MQCMGGGIIQLPHDIQIFYNHMTLPESIKIFIGNRDVIRGSRISLPNIGVKQQVVL